MEERGEGAEVGEELLVDVSEVRGLELGDERRLHCGVHRREVAQVKRVSEGANANNPGISKCVRAVTDDYIYHFALE